MTIRRTTASAISLTLGLALAFTGSTPAVAATTSPELVGTSGSDYGPFYTLGDAVYGVQFGSLTRIDGASPEFLVSGFDSVGQGVEFAGALHIVAQENSPPNFENTVFRVTADGTVTQTLDLNVGAFLSGVRALGATSTTMYASTWVPGGGVVRSTTDGTSWSTFTNPTPFPDFVTRLIGVGADLYAQGSQTSPSLQGVFRYDGTTWTHIPVPGGVAAIDRGDGRLLVGTSEGLYSIVGSTVTELVDAAQNPRTIAELGGVVYWVDDSNTIQALDDGVVSTPFPGLTSGANLTATASELYFTALEGGVRSTYRVALLPTEQPGGGDGTNGEGERDEIADTGTSEVTPLIAGLGFTLLLLGTALVLGRSRTSTARASR